MLWSSPRQVAGATFAMIDQYTFNKIYDSKYMNQRGKLDKSTIRVGDFNINLSTVDKTSNKYPGSIERI